MKKLLFVILLAIFSFSLVGCNQTKQVTASHEDGTYRGFYSTEVEIQFTSKDNLITAISFRTLSYGSVNYRTSDSPTIVGLKGQYEELINYLIGKDIRESLVDLYEPGEFVSDFETYSGSTIRSSKVISAIRDALNRGVYSY